MKPSLRSLIILILIGSLFAAGCITGNADAPLAPNVPVSPEAFPDITGVWISENEAGYNLNTTVQPVVIGKNTWIFTSQDGHIAEGHKVFYQPDGTFANQTMVGIIEPDRRSVYILDQPGGWAKGTLTDPDTMFLVLTYTGGKDTGGNSFIMTMTFHRLKG